MKNVIWLNYFIFYNGLNLFKHLIWNFLKRLFLSLLFSKKNVPQAERRQNNCWQMCEPRYRLSIICHLIEGVLSNWIDRENKIDSPQAVSHLFWKIFTVTNIIDDMKITQGLLDKAFFPGPIVVKKGFFSGRSTSSTQNPIIHHLTFFPKYKWPF